MVVGVIRKGKERLAAPAATQVPGKKGAIPAVGKKTPVPEKAQPAERKASTAERKTPPEKK